MKPLLILLFLFPLAFSFSGCMAPGPLLPPIPEEAPQVVTQNTTKKRMPSSNNPGDLAQFAIKGDYAGTDEKGQPCRISIRGWGNDGMNVQKEYHEFKVTGFPSMIQTQFWARSVDRTQNSFKSKFILVGTKIVPLIEKQKVILNVFLDDDQKNILGYIFVLDKESERTQTKCTVSGSL